MNWLPRNRACTPAVNFFKVASLHVDWFCGTCGVITWRRSARRNRKLTMLPGTGTKRRSGSRLDLHLARYFKSIALVSQVFLCRVISTDVLINVNNGSTMSLQKKFPRKVKRFCQRSALMPASPPVRCSPVRAGFASVTTLPTRKLRYSSFKVGARNAR